MPAPADLVHQQSTSTGTGNLTLAAVTGRRTFAEAFGTGPTTNVFTYFITGQSDDLWEIGTGHMSNSTTLVRDTVIKSSNSDAAVDFTGSIVDVMNDIQAANQVRNESGTNTDGDLAVMDGTTGRKIKSGGISSVSDIGNQASYTGQVATKCRLSNSFFATNKQFMFRSAHFAREDLSSFQVVWGNWYVDPTTGLETAPGASATITASLEYPLGTITQIKFSGSASGSIADGANIVSDACTPPVVIPKGERFWLRVYWTSTAGLIFSDSYADKPNGERGQSGVSGITDVTTGGTMPNVSATSGIYPIAIIGATTNPTVLIIGDSRNEGHKLRPNGEGYCGNFETIMAPHYGCINMAHAGETCQQFISTHAKRVALKSYVTHVIIQEGINDISGGRSAAQISADLTTMIGYFSGKQIYTATIEPKSTSSDSFATVANQTADANNSVRTTLNASIRSGLAGAAGYFEIADIVESARDSGKWKANGQTFGFTDDGTHSSADGMLFLRDSRTFDPRSFNGAPNLRRRFASGSEAAAGAIDSIPLSPRSLASRPAFYVTKSADQTGIAASTQTDVTFDTIGIDVGGFFDTTNNWWQPPAGTYFLDLGLFFTAGIQDQVGAAAYILQDGVIVGSTLTNASGTGNLFTRSSVLVKTDGTSRFKAATLMTGTGAKTVKSDVRTRFFGYAV